MYNCVCRERMKAVDDCRPCLARLLAQAAGFATEIPEKQADAIVQGTRLLDSLFSTERTSIAVATPLHRLVREMTSNPDPYAVMKAAEVQVARELKETWGPEPCGDLRSCLTLAVRGNNIDFFKDIESLRAEASMPVAFYTDDIELFEEKLRSSGDVLYLADNSGEVIFDLPLYTRMREYADVTYVVKSWPAQNDITIDDLERFGLRDYFDKVMTTGTDTPGVDMEIASDEFRDAFEAADLVLAKGMGYWETLTELPAQGKVFHLLRAKCKPVADSLGVPLDSYVAVLR